MGTRGSMAGKNLYQGPRLLPLSLEHLHTLLPSTPMPLPQPSHTHCLPFPTLLLS